MFQTGIFNNNCKLWRRQPADIKTWTRFKEFIATAHKEWRESQTTTVGVVARLENRACCGRLRLTPFLVGRGNKFLEAGPCLDVRWLELP